jgi:hypothetical protein
MNLVVHRIAPLLVLPGRRTWGEAWWTARDICITNQPELPEALQAIADALSARETNLFLTGRPGLPGAVPEVR